jgi:DNA-binding beta-propeller fold protein YncE
MPPLQLTSLLQDTLPHLSDKGRAVLSALGCVNGRVPGSAELAAWLGFHDRYQFARAMRREGLPPLEKLGGWTRTLYWLLESETSGATLRSLADRDKLDPAVAYRLIRRVTGRRWSEVRREGLAVALLRFRDQCPEGRTLGKQIRVVNGNAAAPRRVALGKRAISTAKRWSAHQPPARLRGALGERVPVPGAPFDVSLTSTNVALVTRHHAAAVDVLELDPPRVAQTIHVGPVPSRVVPSPGGDCAYVTSQFSEAVDVVDLERGVQIAEIHIEGHPLGAVLSSDGQTLYIATNRDRLTALSISRRAVVGDIAIPQGSLQLCRDPVGRRVYASGWRTGTIEEVQLPTLKRLRTFHVGGIVQEITVSPDGQTLYAANEAGWLDVIHLPSGKHSATLKFGTAAMGLAVSADQTDIVVGLLFAGQVLIVDRRTLVVRARLQTGGRPRLIAAHPNGPILVANEAGWVDFIK